MTKDAQEREQTLVEAHERVRGCHEQSQARQAAFEKAPRPAVSTPAQIQELTQELQFDTQAYGSGSILDHVASGWQVVGK